MHQTISLLLVVLICLSCHRHAVYPPAQLDSLLQSRMGIGLHESAPGLQSSVKDMMVDICSQPLDINKAVQIALALNPAIHKAWQEIGIAEADLWEAGLLSNPFIEGFLRYPNRSRLKIDAEISIMQSLMDVLTIPLKTRVTEAELHKAIHAACQKIIEIALDVEECFIALVAAIQKQSMLQAYVDIAEIEEAISISQKNVSNINSFEQHLRRNLYLAKLITHTEAKKEIIQRKEKLNVLMGLEGEALWTIVQELPPMPVEELSLENLELIARHSRLDLETTRWELERLRRSFPAKAWWTYTEAQGGFSSEREAEGFWVRGPQVAFALPLFNYGQAARQRLEAEYQQACAHLHSLEIQAYAEVREAHALLLVSRQLVDTYSRLILPNLEILTDESEALYNVMGKSIFTLLDNKRQYLQALIDKQMALKEYWMTRVKLDKAVGGKVSLLSAAYIDNNVLPLRE
jgi:cobalt-zinc-cadmium efflux system outer membrane protein